MINQFIFSIILIAFSGYTLADSSVWRVQKGNSVLYIGGTVHVLRQSDFPLPKEFDAAYQQADMLVLETDIGKFSDPKLQQKLLMQSVYADGSTLDKHISAKTFKLLEDYCNANGLPLDKLIRLKPSMVVMTISVMELSKMGAAQEGVDTVFYQRALEDKKRIDGLETVDQQLQYVLDMGKGHEDDLITYSIQDMEKMNDVYAEMVSSWKTGNLDNLNALFVSDMQSQMPDLYRDLITSRNDNWLPLIDTYLATTQKEFILVGAGHLAGDEGVLTKLRKKGYKVEKFKISP